MSEYFRDCQQRGSKDFGGQRRRTNNNLSISTIILMLVVGIFFCVNFEKNASANMVTVDYSQGTSFKLEYMESIRELRNIEMPWDNILPSNNCKVNWKDEAKAVFDKNNEEKEQIIAETYSLDEVVKKKMGSMNEFVVEKKEKLHKESERFCGNKPEKNNQNENSQREVKMLGLVNGYPIEEMLPYIAARNKKVAYYLVAIAKKESDWGKHSPQKNGGTCYNYWGYRGTYNQTESGYSCFDSPAQAIQQVGDRIENLLDRMIDTPEELIVWKCGSTCDGHDPQGVLKWISDVKLYYNKLNS